ncbi:MAG: transcription elongation factor GreA [bacterium]
MKNTYLTEEGLGELKEKLILLKTVRRREIAEAIHTAKEQGDLSENAEYVNAKEEQRRIEERIAKMESIIKNARIVKHVGTDRVSVGNTVVLRCNGKELTYRIVGSNEADPLQYKISNESPVGRALLGKRQKETVTVPTPAGDKECEIVDIS